MPTTPDISLKILAAAPLIMAEIKKAHSVLLCFHPSPDPDSVGSVLAMKFALESMGKKVTVIKGDSGFPDDFRHFPGAEDVVEKDFFETDLGGYDLFLAIDAASLEMVSRRGKVLFPPALKVVVIDHHPSNPGYGSLNLIEPAYPSSCQILFDLFKEWRQEITPDMALNLFMGMYTDTGGFKYDLTTPHTFAIASELAKLAPDFPKTIAKMECSRTPQYITFMGLALSSVETFFGGKLAISSVSLETLRKHAISNADLAPSEVSSFIRSVKDWDIVVCATEVQPNLTKFSFRTHDAAKYDLSKLAGSLGGGGHKSAAGLTLELPLQAAKEKVVEKAKEMYNLG